MSAVAGVDNISAIEVIWTFIGIIGMGFAIMNISFAQNSISYLRELGINNGRMFLAKMSRTTEIVRFTIQAIETFVGVLAMTLANGDLSYLSLRYRLSAYAIQYAIISCAILTLFQSVNSFRLRNHFLSGGSKGDR